MYPVDEFTMIFSAAIAVGFVVAIFAQVTRGR